MGLVEFLKIECPWRIGIVRSFETDVIGSTHYLMQSFAGGGFFLILMRDNDPETLISSDFVLSIDTHPNSS